MSIKNVVLIGAGGNLGPAVLKALLPHFNVTVLSRESSKSTFPSDVKVAKIADSYPHAELVTAFKGQDAVISTVAGEALAQQTNIIDAAIESGVKRFIPGEFGSDTTDPKAVEAIPIFKGKEAVIGYLKSKESTGLTWTGIANSAFFDWGLRVGFLGFDVKNKKAQILDTGDETWVTTNLSTVGEAVAKVLQKPEETKNQFVFIKGARVSANQILAELEKASGSKFEVTRKDSKPFIAEGNEKMNGSNFIGGVYDLIYAYCVIGDGGAWEKKPGYANELLGLQPDNVEETVKRIVDETK